MPRRQIAAICNRHGFYTGEFCVECELNPKKEVFYTSKDKLWEFVQEEGNHSIEIRTKGQWKRYMKERGLNDDVKQGMRQRSEYIKPVDNKKEHHEDLKRTMIGIAQKEGLMPKLRRKRG